MQYCRHKKAENALKIPKFFKNETKKLIQEVFKDNPLAAMLATAWFQQGTPPNYENLPLPSEPYPWDSRIYWKKERMRQAMFQALQFSWERHELWRKVLDYLTIWPQTFLTSYGIVCLQVLPKSCFLYSATTLSPRLFHWHSWRKQYANCLRLCYYCSKEVLLLVNALGRATTVTCWQSEVATMRR